MPLASKLPGAEDDGPPENHDRPNVDTVGEKSIHIMNAQRKAKYARNVESEIISRACVEVACAVEGTRAEDPQLSQ